MATRPGVTPAPPGRRAGASARAQQPITGFFKKATAAEQAAARMEAIAAAAEEAREEASGPPPKRVPGRPRKLVLGLLAALEKPPAPEPPPDRGASKPRGDWWHPALIWPILREVAMRGCFATAVAGLVDRFPGESGGGGGGDGRVVRLLQGVRPHRGLAEVTVGHGGHGAWARGMVGRGHDGRAGAKPGGAGLGRQAGPAALGRIYNWMAARIGWQRMVMVLVCGSE